MIHSYNQFSESSLEIKIENFWNFRIFKKILSFFEKRLSQKRDYLICSLGVLYQTDNASFQILIEQRKGDSDGDGDRF